MKTNYFIALWVLLSFYSAGCNGSNTGSGSDVDSSIISKTSVTDTLQTKKIINAVFCQSDSTKSYALYIPEDSNKLPLPIVFFFDPHGDGLLPVKKYQELADSFHFILAGSNDSKNGNDWNEADNIWITIIDDVQKRLQVDADRIYTAGFSGGGKVATFIALHHKNIKGVIANGAALEDITTAGNQDFSFTAISGEGDMNLTDLIAIDTILDKTLTRHRILFFEGIHEWAPVNTMNIAFDGFQFDAMRKTLIPLDSPFINRFISASQKTIAEEIKKNDFLKAQQSCSLASSMLDDVTDESSWFHKTEDSITHTIVYQKQDQERQNLLQKEENIKAGFQQQFQTADDNYWNKTIADVKSKAKSKSPESAMYQRLQAYLSLAFYSISNQLINQNQNKEAERFVSLYIKADPTNSEAWYFSAILNARNNNAKYATDDLLKAVSLGFNDKKRLDQQPEFSNGQTKINLEKIESKMK